MSLPAFNSFATQRIAICSALLAVAGCGSGGRTTYPVKGKVTYADGTPLSAGRIEFETVNSDHLNRINARGMIQADGAFQLGTYTNDDGAVEGLHRAIVIPANPEAGGQAARGRRGVAARYSAYDSSGLEFTVKPGETNEFHVILDRSEN